DTRVSDLMPSGLTLGGWSVARDHAASWIAGARSYHGPCVVMVYAAPTSWHAAAPATAVITGSLTVGHDATLAGRADGVITYALDKTAGSADFDAVAALYGAWTAPPPDAGSPPPAPSDAGIPDAGAPAAGGGSSSGCSVAPPASIGSPWW